MGSSYMEYTDVEFLLTVSINTNIQLVLQLFFLLSKGMGKDRIKIIKNNGILDNNPVVKTRPQ